MHCTPFHSLPSCTRFFPPLFSSILSFFSFSYPSPISSLPLTLLLPQVQGGVAEWDYEGDRDDERTLQDDPPAQPFGVASKKNGRQVLTKVQCGRFILLFLPFYYHEFSSRCISMYLTESVMSCKSCHFIHHETLHHSSIPYITPHHYPPSSVSPPSLPPSLAGALWVHGPFRQERCAVPHRHSGRHGHLPEPSSYRGCHC